MAQPGDGTERKGFTQSSNIKLGNCTQEACVEVPQFSKLTVLVTQGSKPSWYMKRMLTRRLNTASKHRR
eukprot:1157252-Pelagomonas_calceolata.AAC.4